MNTETKNAILITDKDAQYDERAKRLLGQKSILAHILVKTVDEFMGMNPKEVISYIESHRPRARRSAPRVLPHAL